jgi:hypothetical protein
MATATLAMTVRAVLGDTGPCPADAARRREGPAGVRRRDRGPGYGAWKAQRQCEGVPYDAFADYGRTHSGSLLSRSDHRDNSHQQDLEVHAQGPVLDVVIVELDTIGYGASAAQPLNLRPPGDS